MQPLPFKKLKSIFVTGTDTNVGKTLISAGLARYLTLQQIHVRVFKPFASGGTISTDAKILQKAALLPVKACDEIVAVQYQQPLAPYAASLSEGPWKWSQVQRRFRQHQLKAEFLIVEGIGGIGVPLKKNWLVIDLIQKWKLPTLVVARAGLGTLNHTWMTVALLQKRNIQVVGVVLNGARGKERSEKTNAKILTDWLKIPVWGPLPWNEKYTHQWDQLIRDFKKIGLVNECDL